MNSVLIGMFDTRGEAEQAKERLLAGGFDPATVSITDSADAGDVQPRATGAAGSSAEPNHEQGAIARFFSNIFGEDNVADEHRSGYTATYGEAFNRGAFGVSVTIGDEEDVEKAEQILNAAGAIDIDERSEQWRQEGWTGAPHVNAASTEAPVRSVPTTAAAMPADDVQKLQEVEEELRVGKRAVARGGVRVFSRVIETPVTESVTLREERANVERRVVDRPATQADLAAFKEGSVEVRETAEEAVISKSARVVGEVEVSKTTTEREEVINDTLRKTKVEVESLDAGDVAGDLPASAKPASLP